MGEKEPIDALQTADELLARAEASGEPRWAERAIDVLEDAMATTTRMPGDPEFLVNALPRLGVAWHMLAERTRQAGALDKSVDAFRRALAGLDRSDPRWVGYASNLANALTSASQPKGGVGELDEAISLLTSCRDETADDDPRRPTYLTNLGRALLERANLRNDPESAEAAITMLREALPGAPDDTILLSNLGSALVDQAHRMGDAAMLVEAAGFQERAVDLTPPGQPHRLVHLSNLGNTLLDRFEMAGDEAALHRSVAVHRSVVAQLAPENPELERCLSNLVAALLRLHEFAADDDALHEALLAQRQAVALSEPGSLRRALSLLNLGSALGTAFTRWDDLRDLHDAVDALREAVTALPDGHREDATARTALGEALTRSFELSGDPAELDEAIHELRAAASTTPPQNSAYALRQFNLAGALMRRFDRVKHQASLNEAIVIARRAIDVTPQEHSARGLRLSTLGTLLVTRYIHAGDADDLRDSVAAHRAAVEATGHDRPWQAVRLSGLGVVLLRAWQADGNDDRDALDEAIKVLGKALEAAGPDYAGRIGLCSNLANALRQRYELVGDADDADAAVRLLGEATDRADPEHPDLAALRFNLGATLRTRYHRDGDPARAHQAAEAFLAATEVRTAPVLVRATAAVNAGRIAAEVDAKPLADRGFSAAVGLLDRLAWYGLSRDDQEDLIRRFGGVASDAAAWALEAGDKGRAVELLEHGRGVLLAQAMNARSSHTVLREVAPQLADRLERLDAGLERGSVTLLADGAVTDAMLTGSDSDGERRMALASERDALLQEIAAVGLGELVTPIGIDRLRTAADGGPVVMVNISRYRCDALTVTSAGIQHTRLATTAEEAVQRAVEFIDFVDGVAQSPPDSADPVETVTAWLFEHIAEPVLRDLGLAERRAAHEAPRVWWCPTGVLGFLPLHAARPAVGAGASKTGDDAPGVLDFVVSSYTPTLRALINARSKSTTSTASASPGAPPRAVIVSLPHAPGHAPLPGAARERAKAERQLSGAAVLDNGDATVAAVLDALTKAEWAHLACHGEQDPTKPSEGCLWMFDGPLTVRTLMQTRIPQGRLAVLSACETVRGGADLPDESITLASAVQLAGFRHVVGSLWAAHDAIAVRMVDVFYRDLAKNGFDPDWAARALHHASWQLRERYADAAVWSPFVHVGP